jgi:hypothetical protein
MMENVAQMFSLLKQAGALDGHFGRTAAELFCVAADWAVAKPGRYAQARVQIQSVS